MLKELTKNEQFKLFHTYVRSDPLLPILYTAERYFDGTEISIAKVLEHVRQHPDFQLYWKVIKILQEDGATEYGKLSREKWLQRLENHLRGRGKMRPTHG